MVWVAVSHKLPQIILRALRPGANPQDRCAAQASLPSPHSLAADTSVYAISLALLVLVVRCIFCGVFFLLPVVVPSKIPKLPTDMPVGGFHTGWKLLLHASPTGWVSMPKPSVSVAVFYILSYLLWKRLGCLSGCLLSSPSIQKLFCGSPQHSDDLLMNLWGRKRSPCPIPVPF